MIDLLFLSKLLDDKDVASLELGFLIQGDTARGVLDYCKQYLSLHNALPSRDIVEAELKGSLPDGKLPDASSYKLQELARRLQSRYAYLEINKLLARVDALNADAGPDKPFEALELLERSAAELRARLGGGGDLVSLALLMKEVEEEYERAKRGDIGLAFPFDTMNEYIGGLRAGELLTIVARLGVGKSWFLIYLAYHYWKSGKRILFIPTEMTGLRVAMRFSSLLADVPYSRLRLGALTNLATNDAEEQRFKEQIATVREMGDNAGFWLAGQGFNVSVSTIDTAIRMVRPDIVFVDGLYLLKAGFASSRYDKVSNAIEAIKELALAHNLPFILSTQFNRRVEPEKISTARVENIGLSDIIGWVTDFAVALVQTSDLRAQKLMKLLILKSREGEMTDIDVKWDFGGDGFSGFTCFEVPKARRYEDKDFERMKDIEVSDSWIGVELGNAVSGEEVDDG